MSQEQVSDSKVYDFQSLSQSQCNHQGLVPVSYGIHENYTAARIATLS